MSGCQIVINSGADHFNAINNILADCENSLEISSWSEQQLLAHILCYAPNQEFQFISRAASIPIRSENINIKKMLTL